MSRVQCDMEDACTDAVTHIGEKGWVYCASHAPCRHGYERTRKLRAWELALLSDGKQVPSYRPISKRVALGLVQQ